MREYIRTEPLFCLLRACALGTGFAAMPLAAATYEIGPESALRTIGEAPLGSLQPGDQILIHWRAEPYREKWVISTAGKPESPIVIRGVVGPNGQLPVIDGRDASSSQAYPGEDRAIIKIGDGAASAEPPPDHIVLENLEISGADPSSSFHSSHGVIPYLSYASAIWIQKGSDIVIRNCILRDSANGLITSHESARVLIEKCHIHDNGIPNSTQQHNIYTESDGIVFQFNKVGPLRSGALGNTLKDRSADTVIRYNWLEGGSRILDLVDSDYESLRSRPAYRSTYVYGNVMFKDDTGANKQIVHFGGDSGQEDRYRHGVLNFYHNTVIVYRQPATVLFQLSSADDSVQAVNNIFCSASPGGRISILGGPGQVVLEHNLFPSGWKMSSETLKGDHVKSVQNLVNIDLAFVNLPQKDFRPASRLVSAGAPLSSGISESHPVRFEYREPCNSFERPSANPPDIGAFSYAPAGFFGQD